MTAIFDCRLFLVISLHHVMSPKHSLNDIFPHLVLYSPTERRSLRYLPRPRVFYARNVGSWTCVCAGGSLLLVNQWVQYLMSKNKKAVAEWTQLNISCDTGGLETVAFVTEQEKDCPHCRANRELSAPAPV